MPVTEQELLEQFGRAALAGNAGVFVGAGMSKAASSRFPDWSELVAPLRREADIPDSVSDLRLVAEYFEQARGRQVLEAQLATAIGSVSAGVSKGHQLLAQLPVAELWTTNYDRLLEGALPDATVVFDDGGLANRVQPGRRRLIKMHGSLSSNGGGGWEAPPVVTRGDYERYEQDHPRMWAALTASFLTRSLLFIGFGFEDPNLEVFLRLARRLGWGAPEHFAILRRPPGGPDAAIHRYRVDDLERSGIGVVEIGDFEELVPLLGRLVRRCRPAQLFVSGSGTGIDKKCRNVGRRLASLDGLTVLSLAGEAGRLVSYGFAEELRRQNRYGPDRMRFLFRAKADRSGAPPPAPDERTGVAVYTDATVEDLRRDAIDSARAVLVCRGGERTRIETSLAEELAVPVIPLAATGGAAAEVWAAMSDRLEELTMGGAPIDPARFSALSDPDGRRHLPAAIALVRQAMYL